MADSGSQMSSARLEAFSDGVIAVIITIMVLELHVPREDGWAGLWSVAPRLSVYLLSFLMVGIYGINHHELIRRTESIDYRVLWSNLIFLFVLSLVPYHLRQRYKDETVSSRVGRLPACSCFPCDCQLCFPSYTGPAERMQRRRSQR